MAPTVRRLTEVVLGVSTQHDAGAALIVDGAVVAAVNEERLNRKKLFWGVPRLSIQEVIRIGGIRPSDITRVAHANITANQPFADFDEIDRSWIFRLVEMLAERGLGPLLFGTSLGADAAVSLARLLNIHPFLRDTTAHLERLGVRARVDRVDHHEAHAASAFFTAGWEDALVITLDGAGEGYCAKVLRLESGRLRTLHRIPFFHSPAMYYAYATHLAGFRAFRHEGKITGLAAYGTPDEALSVFRDELRWDPQHLSFSNRGRYLRPEMSRLRRLLGPISREDLAAGIQKHFEELVCAFVAGALARFGQAPVVLAGGAFANVRLNGLIRDIPGVRGMYVFPHMGDGGLAVGAALHRARRRPVTGDRWLPNVFLGPEFSDAEIGAAIDSHATGIVRRPASIEREVARLVHAGRVVARFAGRMEYGPRALGNRSVLCRPDLPGVNAWLNDRLGRTEFMPFAPAILDEGVGEYLHLYPSGGDVNTCYMTTTYPVTQRARELAPGIVHVDGTARPQVVRASDNPSFHRVLTEFRALSGLPLLVNTSFNMHEEPIVCTPSDALRAFADARLDALAIGSHLIERSS